MTVLLSGAAGGGGGREWGLEGNLAEQIGATAEGNTVESLYEAPQVWVTH